MAKAFWRLVKKKYAQQAFDGEGARLWGGRWNSQGLPIVYTSDSLSLAALELLVHLDSAQPAFELVSIQASIPDNLLERFRPREFNAKDCQAIGDEWASAKRSLALEVPSMIITQESNCLINPRHPDFKKIKLSKPSPFHFDERLLKKRKHTVV